MKEEEEMTIELLKFFYIIVLQKKIELLEDYTIAQNEYVYWRENAIAARDMNLNEDYDFAKSMQMSFAHEKNKIDWKVADCNDFLFFVN